MKVLLTLFCFIQLSIIDHNIPIAIFKIHQLSNKVILDITIDAEDLGNEVNLSSNNISKEVIKNYLNLNTSFSFDNKIIELEIKNLEQDGDHLKINCAFNTEIADLKQLEIRNTCLINVDNHSNIIQVNLNNISKDYRMHKNRKTIAIDL